MKNLSILIGCHFSVLIQSSCVCLAPVPTADTLLQRHELEARPFSAPLWRSAAGRSISELRRVRMPMLGDLSAHLNAERPNKTEVLALLGPDEYEQAFGDASVYLVDNPDECWADLYWLVVQFESDGSFKEIRTSCD